VTPAFLASPLPSYLWQVCLHSSIMGLIFYTWVHRVDLPSGRTKRRLLAILLVLPLVTAAVPGRTALEFRERFAWFDSSRVLAIPLVGGLELSHIVLLVVLLTAALTIWQELVPWWRRRAVSDGAAAPDSLARLASSLPGWARCRVILNPSDQIVLATGCRSGQPRLIVSRGAIAQLTPEQLAIAIAHEHAHWQAGRWWRSHALFLVRLLQCYSPVALWAFREYCLEVEIECDRAAVAGSDPNLLVRALLRVYESTDGRDAAARSAIRKRVKVLLGGAPDGDALPRATLIAASALMLVVLPWIV
jgi:hypothetical protein